jgi:hypothetical protein
LGFLDHKLQLLEAEPRGIKSITSTVNVRALLW